jgi:cytochrome oxidase Cu insertion factor (SCO1/SenC/PrrC family)
MATAGVDIAVTLRRCGPADNAIPEGGTGAGIRRRVGSTLSAVPADPPIRPPADPPTLSEAERAQIFSSGVVPVDRSAALRAGRTPVSPKLIKWTVVTFVVLGVGGVIGDRLLGNTGVGTPTTTPSTLVTPSNAAPATPSPPGAPPISASINAFLGLKVLKATPAPAIDLRDQNGAPWSLADVRGKVVVLTFFDAGCTDICPVIGQELADAHALLGATSADVQLVVVNTNPLQTALSAEPPALTQTGLSSLADVTFLNGTVSQLNRVWADYGITVSVVKATQAVTHNALMYFIDPQGRLRDQAIPFANEDQLGVYSLGTAETQRFAQGIAKSAATLVPSS